VDPVGVDPVGLLVEEFKKNFIEISILTDFLHNDAVLGGSIYVLFSIYF